MSKTAKVLKKIRAILSEPDDEETIAKIREALGDITEDWSMLKATQASLREHMRMIKKLEARLAEAAKQEPVAWGWVMDGEVNDCIGPTEHAKCEGEYTVPLYKSPVDVKDIRAETIDNVVSRVKSLFDELGYDPILEEELVTTIRSLK